MTDALWSAGQSLCLQLLHCGWASSIFMTGRAAFNLTVFSAVSHMYQAQAGVNPGPKGKNHSSGIWLFWKNSVSWISFKFIIWALPLCVCVWVPLICLCYVVLSHSALTQILSYLGATERQLNEGKVKPTDERANDTFSNMTLWTEEDWIVQTVFGQVCWLSNGEKDKDQAAISKERSLAREIVPNTYRTVVSFLTGSLGLGN